MSYGNSIVMLCPTRFEYYVAGGFLVIRGKGKLYLLTLTFSGQKFSFPRTSLSCHGAPILKAGNLLLVVCSFSQTKSWSDVVDFKYSRTSSVDVFSAVRERHIHNFFSAPLSWISPFPVPFPVMPTEFLLFRLLLISVQLSVSGLSFLRVWSPFWLRFGATSRFPSFLFGWMGIAFVIV